MSFLKLLFLVLVSFQDYCFVNSYQATLCRDSTYKITCPSNSLINIQSVTYGDQNLPTCSLILINDSISKLCNRNNSCLIESNSELLEVHSCPGIYNYAVISYICYPQKCMQNASNGQCCTFPFVYNSITYDSCTTVNNNGVLWCSMDFVYAGKWGNCTGWCMGFSSEIENDCFGNQSHAVTIYENTSYEVTCTEISLIKIHSAMYGSQEKTKECILNVTDVVQKFCNRTKSCLINSNSTFYGGDPCPGINKYTIVNYICFEEDFNGPSTMALSYMASITSLCKLTYKTESLKPTPSLQNLNFASTTQTLVAINFSSFSIKSSATLTSTQFATIISSTMVFNKTKATNISPSLTNISPSLPYSDDSRAQALSTIGMSGVKIEEWPMWGECSATCGEGSKTSYFMGSAKIPLKRIESCIEMDCPVDGMWGSWIKSGNCTNPCSNERVTYDRMCDSPSPNYNSLDCMGIKSYTEDCQNNIICPVFGNWLEWSNWSLCNQPCGGDGVVSRFRTCFNPKKSGLVFCNGINAETRACFFKNCETVDLNLFVNLSDVEYLDQYPYLISQQSFDLKEKIKNAISRLYKNSKRNVTISIVIHSIKSDNP